MQPVLFSTFSYIYRAMHRLKQILLVLLTATCVLMLCLFMFRNKLLQSAFIKAIQHAEQRFDLQIQAKSIALSGWQNICIEGLTVKNVHNSSIATFEKAIVNINWIKILAGKVTTDDIAINNGFINATELQNALSKLKTNESNETATSLEQKISNYIKKIETLSKASVLANSITIVFGKDEEVDSMLILNLSVSEKHFSAAIQKFEDTAITKVNAIKSKRENQIAFEIEGGALLNNLFSKSTNSEAEFSFSKMNGLVKWETGKENLNISADVMIDNLNAHHWRLASANIEIEHLQFKGEVFVSENRLELTESKFTINRIQSNLSGTFEQKDNNFHAAFQLHMQPTDASVFINSLPKNLMKTVERVQCKGSLEYTLKFDCNTENLDSLIFDSELKSTNLRADNFWGAVTPNINLPFKYQAKINSTNSRQVDVSAENSNYTALDKISPLLKASVLQAEDPSFFRHKGFLPTAFRESVVKNIREKRFARGGSTISMQLVKNIFLSRDKTIARKLEEAMLVYMIENLRLVPKERMFEVYLNIIEWGPNVFGIGEASRFYFNKKPAELNLQESIFLAGIIPNPRVFKYHLERDGTMKPHFQKFAEILTDRMLQRGSIPTSDVSKMNFAVTLKGSAKKFVSPTVDELDDDEDFD